MQLSDYHTLNCDSSEVGGNKVIKTQFTLYLGNKPGMLAKVSRLLAKDGINIEGISVAETSDMSLVQLVPNDANKAKNTLKRAEIAFTSQRVAVFELENRPGELAAMADWFAKHGVNINYLYATTAVTRKNGLRASVVVGADDVKRIEQAWDGPHLKGKKR